MAHLVAFLAALAQTVYALFSFGAPHPVAPLPLVATSTPQAQQQVLESGSSSSQGANAEMKKYTNADLGFSFWYPSSWQVGANYAANHPIVFGNAKLISRFDVGGAFAQPISVMVFESSDTSVDLSGFSGDIKYFFDSVGHQWMMSITGAENGSPDKTVPADSAMRTMGGLHMFDGNARHGAATLIPLSTHRFVYIETLSDPGQLSQLPLATTVVATDPTVATPVAFTTPVSAAEQQQIIEKERQVYLRYTGPEMKTYTDNDLGFSFWYPGTWEMSTAKENTSTPVILLIGSSDGFVKIRLVKKHGSDRSVPGDELVVPLSGDAYVVLSSDNGIALEPLAATIHMTGSVVSDATILAERKAYTGQ